MEMREEGGIEPIAIRSEADSDAAGVREVNEQAFARPLEANLVEALGRTGAITLSLVAVREGRVVGHILFSPVGITADGTTYPAVALGPMSVLPELQNQGIGSDLVRSGLEMLKKGGYELVFVVGHPDFYPRFGFLPASRYGCSCQYDIPDDAFMLVELQPDACRGKSGLVRFRPEFDEV
jgi:putative acetyltransferase